jgi:hypothetical protein
MSASFIPGFPDAITYTPPRLKVFFLGTNRLSHCDFTLILTERRYRGNWNLDQNSGELTLNDYTSEFSVYIGEKIEVAIGICSKDPNRPFECGPIYKVYKGIYTITDIDIGDYIICSPDPGNDNIPSDFFNIGNGEGQYIKSSWNANQYCTITENYYTNEVLKFGIQVVSSGSAQGYKVIGTPKLAVYFSGQNGNITRYAEFKEEFSSYSDSSGAAYFEFHYAIQGVDNGIPRIGLSIGDSIYFGDPWVYDALNTIRWKADSDTDFSFASASTSYSYSGDVTDMTRVRVNMDGEPSGRNSGQVTILLKRSDVPGKAPSSSDILLGEPALNTSDGKLFIKKEDGSVISITPIEPQIFTTKNIDITSSQNDLNLESSATVRLNPTVESANISGFAAGTPGEIKLLFNAGTQSLNILHDSSDSIEGNRVLISGNDNFSLDVNSGVTILYDEASNAWRLF